MKTGSGTKYTLRGSKKYGLWQSPHCPQRWHQFKSLQHSLKQILPRWNASLLQLTYPTATPPPPPPFATQFCRLPQQPVTLLLFLIVGSVGTVTVTPYLNLFTDLNSSTCKNNQFITEFYRHKLRFSLLQFLLIKIIL